MKTKFISIVLILLLSAAFASAQISFGILGGVNFQNINGKDSGGDKLENDMILGYHAGVNVQIPIAPEVFFQPGVLFTTKGAKNTVSSITTTTNLSYIEVPLNLVYKAALGNGYFFLGLGPYVGYGIMGKVKSEGGSISLESDVEFKDVVELTDPIPYYKYYKALDAGGNILFGFEMGGGIFAQANAQLGMLKINPEYKIFPDDKLVKKNTGFGLSLGFRF